ncbi:branched-chain amino acid ABC transporter permease [Pseudogracilibacillus sp. SO30301A]|uniref:branched-chain amino acid ABC transporter permease n=1 Tax=Pseudogracilibacillus sp. SO30301A TaxID=3098291 RepID=UPI00300E2DF0
MELLIQQILNGIIVGSMYALIASGLSLIWGTMKMLNLAHGEFYMLGGFFMFFLNVSAGINPFVSGIISIAIVFIAAVIVQRVVIHYLMEKPGWTESHLIATFGISVLLQNLALNIWGERFKNIPYYVDANIYIFGIGLSAQRILIFMVAVLVIVLFWGFLKYSRFGQALRATSQDRDSATLYGINTKLIYMIAFGVSAILATVAAIMLAPIYSVNPWMGSDLLLKALAVVIIGGLGSLVGAIVGGIGLGILEGLGIIVFSSEWQNVIAFSLLILVLWIRPSGLFGTKEW